MNRRLLSFLALVLLFTGACSDDKDAPLAVEGTNVLITSSSNNKTQKLAVGNTLEIELEQNGGTGYSWELTTEPDATVVDFVSQTTEPKEPVDTDNPVTGAPELVSSFFKAAGTGTTKIVLGHIPPGGGDAEETFTVTVVVE